MKKVRRTIIDMKSQKWKVNLKITHILRTRIIGSEAPMKDKLQKMSWIGNAGGKDSLCSRQKSIQRNLKVGLSW